jgi:hypothetical protein
MMIRAPEFCKFCDRRVVYGAEHETEGRREGPDLPLVSNTLYFQSPLRIVVSISHAYHSLAYSPFLCVFSGQNKKMARSKLEFDAWQAILGGMPAPVAVASANAVRRPQMARKRKCLLDVSENNENTWQNSGQKMCLPIRK